jgi:hypothetical protein
MRRLAVITSITLAGCHVTARNKITRPASSERLQDLERGRPVRTTMMLADTGELHFVELLVCPTEESVDNETATEVTIGPNLATFVVGAIATAVGGVLLVRGIADAEPGSTPFTYIGAAGVVGGLPLAIGPWIGNRTELGPARETSGRRHRLPDSPCGSRPLAAKSAVIQARGVEIYGRIDRGKFAISPFQIEDAFATGSIPSWDATAVIDGDSEVIKARIDGAALAKTAAAFRASHGIDTRVEPIRLVPGIKAGTLRASLTETADGQPMVRLVLPLENPGPGPAWQLRGHVVAPGTPAIDGRMIYIGAIPKGATRRAELLVPVSATAAEQLRNESLELSIELRDAHGTAPATPVRFRGQILVDAPR